MAAELSQIQRAIQYEAGVHLGDIPNIQQGLVEIEALPEGFNQRLSEFDYMVSRLNDLLVHAPLIDPESHGAALILKEKLGGRSFRPTLRYYSRYI